VGAVRLPDEHWANYEEDVDSLTAFVEAVEKIAAFQAKTDTRFVWRGVAGASWALHSPIVRRFKEKHGHVPTEDELRELEQEILKEAREWALDWHSAGGRLTSLELLAALQHYAAPTRMIDFTFNAFVALWFAVEKNDNEPGRVFAVDIAGRTVTRAEASAAEPWWLVPGLPRAGWRRKSWVWRPPPFEPRIVRQDGCFLMGGIPSTTPARRITGYEDPMRAHEVLECMSVPFNLIKFEQARAAAEGRALRGTPRIPAPSRSRSRTRRRSEPTWSERSATRTLRSTQTSPASRSTRAPSRRRCPTETGRRSRRASARSWQPAARRSLKWVRRSIGASSASPWKATRRVTRRDWPHELATRSAKKAPEPGPLPWAILGSNQ
jgi:hypothetical protein